MKMVFIGLVALFSLSVGNASIDTHATDPKPPGKVHLVNSITKKLSDTQAKLLEDALYSLSVDDLREIKDDPKALDAFFWGSYDRDPDDQDEKPSYNHGQ